MILRKNQVDHVAQHWTHDIKRVQQFGLLDFDQLKGLVKEEDLQASMLEWARTKNRKWYHLTHDAFINFLYEVSIKFDLYFSKLLCCKRTLLNYLLMSFQREISATQEEEIRGYKDTLITGCGEDRVGSPSELLAVASKAVELKKTSLSTDLNRYLAIANPANGDGFIEVSFSD